MWERHRPTPAVSCAAGSVWIGTRVGTTGRGNVRMADRFGTGSLDDADKLTGLLVVSMRTGHSALPVRSRPGYETRQRRQLHSLVRLPGRACKRSGG
jgi:hypothetical protein